MIAEVVSGIAGPLVVAAGSWVVAERTWRRSASRRSSWWATRSRASSRRPEPSPASTIERAAAAAWLVSVIVTTGALIASRTVRAARLRSAALGLPSRNRASGPRGSVRPRSL